MYTSENAKTINLLQLEDAFYFVEKGKEQKNLVFINYLIIVYKDNTFDYSLFRCMS